MILIVIGYGRAWDTERNASIWIREQCWNRERKARRNRQPCKLQRCDHCVMIEADCHSPAHIVSRFVRYVNADLLEGHSAEVALHPDNLDGGTVRAELVSRLGDQALRSTERRQRLPHDRKRWI